MRSTLTEKFYCASKEKSNISFPSHKLAYYNKDNPISFEPAKKQLLMLLEAVYKLNPSTMSKLMKLRNRLENDFTQTNITSELDRNAILNILKKELEHAYFTKKVQIKKADIELFNDLFLEPNICYQGILGNTLLLVERLNNTFDGAVLHAKKEAIRQNAIQFIRKTILNKRGAINEIHTTHALYNYVANNYALQKINDGFVPTDISTELLEKFSQYNRREMSPCLIATILSIELNFLSEQYSLESYNRLETYLPSIDQTYYSILLSGLYSEFDKNTKQLKIPDYDRAKRILVDLCLEKAGYTEGHLNIVTLNDNCTIIQTVSDFFLIENIEDSIAERTIIRALKDRDKELILDSLASSKVLNYSASLQHLSQETILAIQNNNELESYKYNDIFFWSLLYKKEPLNKNARDFIRKNCKKTFSLNSIGTNGESVFQLLIDNNSDFLEVLLNDLTPQKAQTWINSITGTTKDFPAHLVTEKNLPNLLKKLQLLGANLEALNNNDVAPVYIAAKNNYHEIMDVLHELNISLKTPNKYGIPPIFAASYQGHADLVKKLITLGVDKDTTDSDGATLAYIAAYRGHSHVLEVLYEQGANLEAGDYEHGDTPAHGAAFQNRIETLEKLAELGIDLTIPNKNHVTPETVARERNHLNAAKRIQELTNRGRKNNNATYYTQFFNFFRSRTYSENPKTNVPTGQCFSVR